MGPDGQESSGSQTILSRQRCSWMSQLYITTRVFTYFHTSLAIIKWWPSGHLLIFCIWPLKPKCLSAMSRPCRLQQCATCHVERDGQMPNSNKKKMTIENWSRENPEVVWKRPFQISMEPIFTTASSVRPRLLGGGPRLFGLRGHNLICSLCVNQVPQCRLAVIGAVSVESSQRFSVPGWILNTTGNTNNSTALLHSISPSVVSWTSLFKTHYFKRLY